MFNRIQFPTTIFILSFDNPMILQILKRFGRDALFYTVPGQNDVE